MKKGQFWLLILGGSLFFTSQVRGAVSEVVLGPVLSFPTREAVTVWWHSSGFKNLHTVRFGTNRNSLRHKAVLRKKTFYPVLRLHDLLPGQTYYYQVGSGNSQKSFSKTYSFRTMDHSRRYRIAMWADNQIGKRIFGKYTVPRLQASRPDCLMVVGDLVNYGTVYQHWFKHLYRPAHKLLATIPWFPVRGNHDGESTLAKKMLPFPGNRGWYSFRLGPIAVIVLDTNLSVRPGSPQYKWLKKKLASPVWKSAVYRMAAFHHPPFTNYWHTRSWNYTGNKKARRYLVPLLEEAETDLVFSGHAHCYAHGIRPNSREGRKTHYFTIGGGGGDVDKVHVADWSHIQTSVSTYHIAILDVSPKKLRVRIEDTVNKTVIDEVWITNREFSPLAGEEQYPALTDQGK